MFEDIVENASFCFQIGNLLTFVHNWSFVVQMLNREQKQAFVQAVQSRVDADYAG